MSARIRVFLLVVGTLLGQLCARAAVADVVADARKLYEQGVQAHEAGEFAHAADLFEKSYRLVRHSSTLRNLADSDVRAGRPVQAARHYRELLDGQAQPALDPNTRRLVETALAELETEIGGLKISVNVAEATVTVDGDLVGKSPVGFVWHVAPGPHEILAQKPGLAPKGARVEVPAGSVRDVAIIMGPEETAPRVAASGPTSGDAANPPAPDRMRTAARTWNTKTVALIVGVALTAGALGLTGVFALQKSSAKSDAKTALAQANQELGSANCTPDVAACRELADANERKESAGQRADIALVASGVFGLATVGALLFWPASGTREAAANGRWMGSERRPFSFAVAPITGGGGALARFTF